MSIREALIVWIDIQIFENKNDSIVEEIWETISKGNTSKLISKSILDDIHETVNKGHPYPLDMFSKVKEELFKAMRNEEYSVFVESCTLASIYSKRRWNSGISMPDVTFDRLVEECDVKSWKLKKNSQNIKVYEKKMGKTNISFMDETTINAPIDLVQDLVFFKQGEYDKDIVSLDILEKINEETCICHLICSNNLYPIVKKRDLVYLVCVKKLSSGKTTLLFTSCDHKDAPETKDCVRVKVSLAGSILTPLSSTSTHCMSVTQVIDSGKFIEMGGIQRKLVRKKGFIRAKALRECAEKQAQAK